MNSLGNVFDFCEKGLDEEVCTGISFLVSRKGEIIADECLGKKSPETEDEPDTHTNFDLASLTKPLATTIFFQLLWQRGKVSPEDRVCKYLNIFGEDEKREIRIENLLLHDSGLPAHRPFYRNLSEERFDHRETIRLQLIDSESLVYSPGNMTLYSDLGFMVLKSLLEKVAEEKMGEYLKREFYEKIGAGLFFPSGVKSEGFWPTSFSVFRGKRLLGEVDDENAFSIGGEDGHAGLFGNAGSVHRVLCELYFSFRQKKRVILKSEFTKEVFKKRNKKRFLGFDCPSGANPSCGKFFSEHSPGHLGFTGTSFWMDLNRGVWIILLTNRVYFGANNFKIRNFRPDFHNIINNLL